ncbi:MAG: PQQ-binding-like beta-propeller repeat protein [Rhodothermales bacterium]
MTSSTLVRVAFAASLFALLITGCSSFSSRTHTVTPEDWAISGADLARSSMADLRLEPPLEKVWEHDLGAGAGPGSALITGNLVLIANRKGQLLVLDGEKGKRVGRTKFDAPVEGGMAIADNMLIVPGAKRKASLYGYDLGRGKVRWKLRKAAVQAGVLTLDSLAVVVDATAMLRVVDTASGKERWTHALDSMAYVIGAPVAEGPVVYVANENGVLYAVDVVREQRQWRRDLGSPVYQGLGMAGDIVLVPTTRGRLFGIDARTGATRWTLALPDTTVRFSATAYDHRDGVLVVGTTDGRLRALRADSGSELWVAEVESPITAAPLLTRQTVFVGTLGRKLLALDRNTGARLWEYEMPGRVTSALAAADDLLIVLSEPQRIVAFRMPQEMPVTE